VAYLVQEENVTNSDQDKTTILTFVSWYFPGYKSGGPAQSIANLIENLGDEFNFLVVTRDRDLGDTTPYPEVESDAWNEIGKAKVRYLVPKLQTLRAISKLLRETPHDILYLNSVWDRYFTTLPLLILRLGGAPRPRRIIISPRGGFSPGALKLRRRVKTAYLWLTRCVGLYNGAIWQASTSLEAENIRQVMELSESRFIEIASDLPRKFNGDPKKQIVSAQGTLRIAFLSRISPMKNLLFALQVLRDVQANINFTIYGPNEDEKYWDICSGLIDTLPDNVSVEVAGVVPSTDVVPTLAKHDLFFLPTLGENFGHVIVEALQAGLPTLISDNTPWRNLEDQSLGADLSLDDPEAFVEWIENYAAESSTTKRRRRDQVLLSIGKMDHISRNINDNRNLFIR
jgi:glycosyltransferase involved in cell wall biosynthesis